MRKTWLLVIALFFVLICLPPARSAQTLTVLSYPRTVNAAPNQYVDSGNSVTTQFVVAPVQGDVILCDAYYSGGSLISIYPPSGYTQQATASSLSAIGASLFSHTVGASEGTPALAFSTYEIAAPSSPTLSTISGSSAGTAQYVKLTYVNVNGESLGSTYSSLTPTSSQQVQVISPPSAGNATGYNVYASTTSGGTYHKQNSSVVSLGTNFTLPGTITTTGNTLPTSDSTAPNESLGVQCFEENNLSSIGAIQNSVGAGVSTLPFVGYTIGQPGDISLLLSVQDVSSSSASAVGYSSIFGINNTSLSFSALASNAAIKSWTTSYTPTVNFTSSGSAVSFQVFLNPQTASFLSTPMPIALATATPGGTATPSPSPSPSPSPTPTSVPSTTGMMPLYAYWGNGAGGCAGADMGAATTQQFFKALENCGGAGFTKSALEAECSQAANKCHPVTYNTMFQIECGASGPYENGFYTWVTTNDEAGLLHDASPISASNEFKYNKGGGTHCPPTTGNYYVYGNPGDATANTWWYNNVVLDTTDYFPDNWWWEFIDDMSLGPNPSGVTDTNGKTIFSEYSTIASWRTAVAAHVNAMCPTIGTSGCFKSVGNSLGPGAAKFPDNNATGVDIGISGWAVDTADMCNNLTKSNFMAFVSEDPFEDGVSAIPSNIKDLLNSATQIYGNPNCAGINILILGHSSSTQSTNDLWRRLYTAASWILQPNDNSQRVWMWRFSVCLCDTEQGVYGEEEITPLNPEQNLSSWSWGGTSDGSGCHGTTGDSGGPINLVQGCGTLTGRLDAGLLVREFHDCKVRDVDMGPCAAIFNGTNQPQTISSSWFTGSTPMSAFKHYVSWTGQELKQVVVSGTTYSFNCTGPNCTGSDPDFTSYPFPGVPFGGTTSNVVPAGDGALLVGW